MDANDIEVLSHLNHALGVVSYERDSHEKGLSKFLALDHGLMRVLTTPPTRGSRTGSSFAVFALNEAGILRTALDWDGWGKLSEYFLKEVAEDIVPIAEVPAPRPDPHLNEYSIPIWATGLLTLAAADSTVEATLAKSPKLKNVILGLADELLANNGCFRRVSSSPDAPSSAYLTFWATIALTLAESATTLVGPDKKISDALARSSMWAEAALSQLVADHHANLQSRFDVVEFLCSACVAWRLSERGPGRPADELRQLSIYAISLALDSYFQNGSFKLSRPVFADEKHNAILCPTSEALLFVLSSLSLEALAGIFGRPSADGPNSGHGRPRWHLLMEAFQWSQRHRRATGYPPDATSPFSVTEEATVFSTSSTIAFFKLLEGVLDKLADRTARHALEVSAVPALGGFDYPDDLKKMVTDKIVVFMKDPRRRPFAKHSIILHGPPGTAKTSIAQQIAADLGWPFKLITQSDFLKSGRDKIETEADKIFTACAFLKDVVVLFDELEELILSRDALTNEGVGAERDSRLLTTSMLPKIHELRDRRRIVFVFATNRLRHIDQAATRLGRFDMIYGVDYPSVPLLKTAGGKLLLKMKPLCGTLFDAIEKFVDKVDLQHMTTLNNEPKVLLTYKDIEYIFEEIIADFVNNQAKPGWKEPWDLVNRLILRRHEANKQTYGEFTKLKSWDRM
jgi:hypothetical protein